MSKKKTVMQELIEFIEYNYGDSTLIGDKAKSLLNAEKKQIVNTFNKGRSLKLDDIGNYFDGEDYVSQIFDNSVVF